MSRFLHSSRLGGRAGVVRAGDGRLRQGDDNARAARRPSAGGAKPLTKVKLQLQWFTQAQFAGYFAAVREGLLQGRRASTSQILEGGVDIVPADPARPGPADYAIAWVPKALRRASRAPASPTSARSSSARARCQVSFKNKNITTAADLKGKKVGNWGFGNEFELFAGMTKAGLEPGQGRHARPAAVRHAGAAEGRHRRRPGDDLQRVRPGARGQEPEDGQALHSPTDFNIIDWNTEGTAMLQDAIWANTEKLSDKAYQDQTVKFLQATLQGLGVLPGQRREVPRHRRREGLEARRRATSCGR